MVMKAVMLCFCENFGSFFTVGCNHIFFDWCFNVNLCLTSCGVIFLYCFHSDLVAVLLLFVTGSYVNGQALQHFTFDLAEMNQALLNSQSFFLDMKLRNPR